MSNSQSRRRRGFTLSELSVAMVAGSSLMLLSIGMVQSAFHWTKLSRQRIADDRSFDQLQRQFRNDVHGARDASIDDTSLTLSMADQKRVAYTVVDDAVRRVEMRAEKPVRTETYRLSDSLKAAFRRIDQPQRIVLSVRHQPQLDDQPSILWRHVESVIGRNHLVQRGVIHK